MTIELEQRLRDALSDDAQRARLVNLDGPPAPEARPLSDRQERRRPSARRLTAVAAAIVLLVAASVAVIQRREPVPDESTPAGLEEVFAGLSLGDAGVFADIPPGATVELPPSPLGQREPAAVVWTGSEMIVWGGRDAAGTALADGAAFDLAAGTWRVIAPAPIEARDSVQAAWTGTEMVLWGGEDDLRSVPMADGAAYDPTTDTWRPLPDAPIGGGGTQAVWTGAEVIFESDGLQMAAYDPQADGWRRLADPLGTGGPVSSGETFLAIAYPDPDVVDYPDAGQDMGSFPVDLARFEVSSNTWEPVYDTVVSDTLVDVTDAAGLTRAVLVLTQNPDAPLTVLDSAGRVVGTLPVPGSFTPVYQTLWAGEEVLFGTAGDASGLGDAWWALDVATQTWRQFDAEDAPPSVGLTLAADAGVLLGWGAPSGQGIPASTGVVYRPPAPGGEDTNTDDPRVDALDELPVPGEQPADRAFAEEQVRAAFLELLDESRPREERAHLSEHPEVWFSGNQALAASQYGELVKTIDEEVVAVVFTSPTHAAVRFRLISADAIVPRDHVGDAVLVDGTWRVASTTTCDLLVLASVQCDMTP